MTLEEAVNKTLEDLETCRSYYEKIVQDSPDSDRIFKYVIISTYTTVLDIFKNNLGEVEI